MFVAINYSLEGKKIEFSRGAGPHRGEEWIAYLEGTVEDGVYGYGLTQFQAVMDLFNEIDQQRE